MSNECTRLCELNATRICINHSQQRDRRFVVNNVNSTWLYSSKIRKVK